MVVTDTCAVMRKCWAIVQDEFPWISAAPCQTHCPSLLINDIAKLPVPVQTLRDETLVVSWFTNHHKPQAILREKVRAALGKSCELKKAGATRMGTHTWVGERLEELKGCLQQVVVDPAYVAEKYKDVPADVDVVNGEKVSREHKGGTAKMFVLDDTDGGFWSNVCGRLPPPPCDVIICVSAHRSETMFLSPCPFASFCAATTRLHLLRARCTTDGLRWATISPTRASSMRAWRARSTRRVGHIPMLTFLRLRTSLTRSSLTTTRVRMKRSAPLAPPAPMCTHAGFLF